MANLFARQDPYSLIPYWDRVEPFEAALKLQCGPSTRCTPVKSTTWRKFLECFPQKLIFAEERKTYTSLMTWG